MLGYNEVFFSVSISKQRILIAHLTFLYFTVELKDGTWDQAHYEYARYQDEIYSNIDLTLDASRPSTASSTASSLSTSTGRISVNGNSNGGIADRNKSSALLHAINQYGSVYAYLCIQRLFYF